MSLIGTAEERAAQRRVSELAFQESLVQDITNEYEQLMDSLMMNRDEQRRAIQALLRSKFPDTAEGLVSPDEQRLLRLNSRFLSEQEREQVQRIKNRVEGYRIRCYNLSREREEQYAKNGMLFIINIPGIPVRFCVNVIDSLSTQKVNADLNLVDVMIFLPGNEAYRYPLSQDEAESFLGTVLLAGEDPTAYRQMRFPDVERVYARLMEAKRTLRNLTWVHQLMSTLHVFRRLHQALSSTSKEYE